MVDFSEYEGRRVLLTLRGGEPFRTNIVSVEANGYALTMRTRAASHFRRIHPGVVVAIEDVGVSTVLGRR